MNINSYSHVLSASAHTAPEERGHKTLFVIAGEPSGDALGGALLAAIQQLAPGQVRFEGVGGEHMAAQGLHSLFPMRDLSVMGVFEVLHHLPRLLKRLSQTKRAIGALQPDAVLTIDAPDFGLRIQRYVAQKWRRHIRRLHYVAPTVWAWRPGRAAKIAKFLDALLCLFPMEPDYFRVHDLTAPFVGHPLIETMPQITQEDVDHFWLRHHLPPDARLLCILPGSRQREVASLLPSFLAVAHKLVATDPTAIVVIPTLPHLYNRVAKACEPLLRQNRVRIVLEPLDKYITFRTAEMALHASGTVALELALSGTPMVTAYKVSALSAWVAKRLLTTRHVNLVNILLQKPVVPELLQRQAAPQFLWPHVQALWFDAHVQNQQRASCQAVRHMLTPPGASPAFAAAQVVLAQLGLRQ